MKSIAPPRFTHLIVGLLAVFIVSLSSCVEDDDFYNFRPVTFIIKADFLTVEAGKSITFRDSSIDARSRSWTFPGGTPESSTDPMPTVRYDSVGIYNPTVTTTFADGTSQTRTLEVTVVATIEPDFRASAVEALPGSRIDFTNETRGVGDIPPTMIDSNVIYKWVFEGVSSDTIIGNNPSVVYDELGTYDVSLTVIRRSTSSRVTVVKEDFIQIVSALRIDPDRVEFNEEGSQLVLTFREPLSTPDAADISKLSLMAGDGSSVTINSLEASGNNLVLNLAEGSLIDDETYKLSYSGGTLGFASGAIVSDLDELEVTYYGAYSWVPVDYSTANGTRDVIVNGKTFEWTTADVRGGFKANGAISLLHPTDPNYFVLTTEVGPKALTLQVTPKDGANFGDLRAIALELYNMGPAGTTYTFSHPVRVIQTSAPDHPDTPLVTSLSEGGKVVTLDSTPGRFPTVRMVVLLENPADAANFTMTSSHGEPTIAYPTPSGF
ncbi:PKD domain-containing protein [Lewinella sp. JB7]|uniref:PKD domain-containing protein n=1 Tax=Lewinella sp. JB7 TaxID=2962887 RepID=UPI0020C9E516|nr:hypothetical protein [Lewinella sp. JB7]MCP9235846.1 hypothetical protein [Lewinella sp. JB7]